MCGLSWVVDAQSRSIRDSIFLRRLLSLPPHDQAPFQRQNLFTPNEPVSKQHLLANSGCGLNRDLGFSDADRVENTRRVAEVAKLMVEAGLIVLVSFISPFAAERKIARNLFAPGEFLEVFVDTPFDECAKRDVKGLYARALRGEVKNFTGLDSPYEAPQCPEVHVLTAEFSPEQCVEQLLQVL